MIRLPMLRARVASTTRLPRDLTLREAKAIAGTLTKTTKMPGWSYSLDARRCRKGGQYHNVPGATCHRAFCYAKRDTYRWSNVRRAQALRHLGLAHDRWADAMVVQIRHRCRPDHRGRRFFRWHDSGDIQSVEHLRRIVEVCERTPDVDHYMPTKEYGFVDEFLRSGDHKPDNLTIRLSEVMVDEAPTVPPSLAHLPTATVQSLPGRAANPVQGSGSIVCPAEDGGGRCDDVGPRGCRACWEPSKRNVSYPHHD